MLLGSVHAGDVRRHVPGGRASMAEGLLASNTGTVLRRPVPGGEGWQG